MFSVNSWLKTDNQFDCRDMAIRKNGAYGFNMWSLINLVFTNLKEGMPKDIITINMIAVRLNLDLHLTFLLSLFRSISLMTEEINVFVSFSWLTCVIICILQKKPSIMQEEA